MKRILFVVDSLGRGGAERALVDLLGSLDPQRYEVELLTIFAGGELAEELPAGLRRSSLLPDQDKEPRLAWVAKAALRRIEGRILRSWLERDGARRLMAKVASGRYEIVVSFLEGMSTYLVSKAAIDCGRRVAWVHIDLAKHEPFFFGKKIGFEVYREYDAIGVVSQAALESFKRLSGDRAISGKARLAPMPVDAGRVLALAKAGMDLPHDLPIAAIVARLEPQKRVDRAIRAHAAIRGRGLGHRLVIAGDGSERSRLEELARELGVEESVLFLGSIPNPYPLMRLATLVVLSSDYEGLSLVVAEAMLLGKVILSTATAGPPELLAGGRYGRLCPINDEAFEAAMEELLRDDEARGAYERALREDRNKLPIRTDYREIMTLIEGV